MKRLLAKSYSQKEFSKPPDYALLTPPLLAARIAGYYWKSHDLNQLADVGDFRKITRKINGGYNGLDDRLRRWSHAKEVLGC